MKKIIIIEDEKMLAEIYRDKFKKEGFDVLLFSEGKEGIKSIFDEKPDILILDILLPDIGGIEILKKVRENGQWGENLPIIMLTNLDSNDHILIAIEKYHPSYYFIKTDIEPSEIVEKAKELLK